MGAALKYTDAIQWKLLQWAKWHNSQSYGAKGYPKQSTFRRLLGGSVPSALIDDHEGERVHAAHKRLKFRCYDQAIVIELYYLDRMTVEAVRRYINTHNLFERKVSLHKIRQLLAQGETAMDYLLNPEGE